MQTERTAGSSPDDDQRAVLGLEDSVEPLPERGARRDQRQRVVQRLAAAGTVGHPGIVPGPLRDPTASDRGARSASASVRTPWHAMPGGASPSRVDRRTPAPAPG